VKYEKAGIEIHGFKNGGTKMEQLRGEEERRHSLLLL
jgi:hypothetical protein